MWKQSWPRNRCSARRDAARRVWNQWSSWAYHCRRQQPALARHDNLISEIVVDMTWMFRILILSTLEVVSDDAAIYLRIRRHMRPCAKLRNEVDHVGSQHEA